MIDYSEINVVFCIVIVMVVYALSAFVSKAMLLIYRKIKYTGKAVQCIHTFERHKCAKALVARRTILSITVIIGMADADIQVFLRSRVIGYPLNFLHTCVLKAIRNDVQPFGTEQRQEIGVCISFQ